MGNLTPTRDLTFVKDTCTGFQEIYKSDVFFGGATNIWMNSEISIGDLINLISSIMGISVDIVQDDKRIRPDKSEVSRLLCNNTKLTTHTKWKPKFDLEKGLEASIEWMRNNRHYYKANDYNV